MAQMPPSAFVQQVLLAQANAKAVVVGFNYSFGRDAIGSPAYLERLLQPEGIPVHVISPVLYEGTPVSSSRIRQCLQDGDFVSVEAMLGRPYSISGVVQLGDQRGRQLGYPTANIYNLEGLALPPFGVYAAEIGGLGVGMANLGLRPTFPQAGASLEVHILDFSGDLYGQEIEVKLLRHVRPERQFMGVADLQQQLALDEKQVRGLSRMSI
jgi:riboflavin kinase/FMN adenylyltransferase